MLEVSKLGCIRGDRRLFSDLSFSAGAGELIELRGPNGSGKTSLLRILCGLSSPAEGQVGWNGKSIRSLGEEYFRDVAYLAHQNAVKDELSAVENLRIASGTSGNALGKQQARDVLERIGLSRQQNLPARALSAGQRRRLALARLLTSRARLWLLDEVLTSLDNEASKLSAQFISDHLKNNGIAIVATHQDLNLSAERTQCIQLGPSNNTDGISAFPEAS
ncbi:MAG: heme ABC transporter ATP-binding protein CcmA [Acidobacteria bacterium]|nr:MAG: heme ABC transporter ATP-binding protein CcmA [Acidobacteriota bacterium]